MRKWIRGCLFTIFFLLSMNLSAEMSFSRVFADYHRIMQLTGEEEASSLMFHTFADDSRYNGTEFPGPWAGTLGEHVVPDTENPKEDDRDSILKLIAPEFWTSYNSARPWGGNDGAIWQGRGFNTQMSGGVSLKTPHISLQFKPEFWLAQNQDFEIIETPYSSGFGDYWMKSHWEGFDRLQRYGDDMYSDFNFGESFLRANWQGLSLGISNESITVGPGRKNAILLSDHAGGFPHADFGTNGKVQLGEIADLEFTWLWGLLKESEFYDDNPDNDRAWFSGTYTSVSPYIIPNFTIGFAYQYYKPMVEWDAFDLIRGIPFADTFNSPTDNKDMMISILFSWHFPEVGFEVYGEWARNDHFSHIEDLYSAPEHTHAFTIGGSQRVREWENNVITLSMEFSSLAQERTREIRAAGPWYRHGWAGWTQGFTNNGQIAGAAIGPGSDSQWLELSWIKPDGLWALSLQRIAHDKDYFYSLYAEEEDSEEDEVINIDELSEFSMMVETIQFFNSFEVFAKTGFSFIMNNNYVNGDHIFNLHFMTGIKYAF